MTTTRKSYAILDTKLDVLKELIEEREQNKERENYYAYASMYDIVKNFVIKKKLITYGGSALNELLPNKNKFYGEFDLPDFDCFSINAKRDAIQLSHILRDNEYNFVEVKAGIHEGTYKVYAEFKVVADITNVSNVFFEYMLKQSKNNNKEYQSYKNLTIVPIVFLKWSFYKELSRPEGSMHRWEKLFSRYLTFTKNYKTEGVYKIKDLVTVKYENDMADIIYSIQQLAKTRNYPLIGNFALGLHLGKNKEYKLECCKNDEYFSTFEFLSTNPDTMLNDIINNLDLPIGHKLIIQKRNSNRRFLGEVMPYRIRGYIQLPNNSKYSLFTIFSTSDSCYSVVDIEGYRVGTVDTLLTFFYGYLMIYDCFVDKLIKKSRTDVIISYIALLENHANNIVDSKKRFSTVCYGDEKTLFDIRKEQWDQKGFLYRPTPKKSTRKQIV